MPLFVFAGNVSAGTSELSTSGDWSVAGNWSPAAVPQATDDASVRSALWAVVSGNVGSVKSLVVGDSDAEGALNLYTGGLLSVLNPGGISVRVAGPGQPYPSFYSHSAGDVTTQGDFVVGDTGLAGDAFFSSGSLVVGGGLRVGSVTGSLSSVFRLNGGGGLISANALEVGAAGTIEFNFLGGNSLKTLGVTGSADLQTGSTLVISNAGAVGAATYTLIEGASLSGIFTNVELRGFNGSSFPSVTHDSGSGNVLLVVEGPDAVFNNNSGFGDFVWSNPDNWESGAVAAITDRVLNLSNLVVDSQEEAAYLTIGDVSANAAVNLYPNGDLTLANPGISMIVGGAANGPGYPSYYSHSAGTLTTAGDMILGANGASVEAFFSSGSITVGGTLRIGSYQSSGAARWELRGGDGTVTAGSAEIGAAGTLAYDFLGGNSAKTMAVSGTVSIKAGATLTIQGAANVGPYTYTLIDGGELDGVFDHVNFTGFPVSVTPRLWYDAAVGDLKLVVEPAENAAGPIGGFSKVVPLGAAGYSFGIAADDANVFYTDYNAGTITRIRNGVSTIVLSGYPDIYGVVAKDGKIYFATGTESDCSIYGATLTDGVPGTVSQLATGFVRVRQLFVETSGMLLAAIEGEGRIIRINPLTNAVSNVISGLSVPQAAVSDAAGNVYFNEYGLTDAVGTPLVTGKLWKLTSSGQRVLLHETWRARGLILLSNTRLGLLAEANRADQGNSSSMTVVTTDGVVTDFLQGFDYSEFGATNGFMQGLTTCPRDRAVLSFLTGNTVGSDIPVAFRSGVTVVATVKGEVFTSAQAGSQTVEVTGLAGGSVTLHVRPDLQGRFAGWVRMSASEWPSVPTTELPYPDAIAHIFTPGVYAVPDVGVVTAGSILHDQVFAQRSQGLSRWPMQNVGTSSEAPQPGFSETPDAFMAFIEIGFAPDTATFTNGAADNLWARPNNWNPAGVPGGMNEALLSGPSAIVDSDVGSVNSVTVGDAAGNAALNIYPGAVLTAGSITVGAINNASSFPSYYSHAAGDITTAGDFILGSNAAASQSFFSSGSLTVGGTLRLGSHASAGASVLTLNGGGGSITAGVVEIGAAGTLVFDFLGGNSLKTLKSSGPLTLLTGSSLSLTNAAAVGPATYTLLSGDSLQGTFSSFSIAGLPSQYQAAVEYDTVNGEVRLVVTEQSLSGFNQWSGTLDPPTSESLLKYAVGGATSPSAASERSETAVDGVQLSLIAIVRTDDPALVVTGEASTALNGWSSAGVTFTTVGINQAGVPAGAERRKYSVDRNGNPKLFLRLRVTYP